MGGLERRLERLEADRQRERAGLSKEALRRLSDEDLDGLEDALEASVQEGHGSFEDLYMAVTERSRRALDALLENLEALSRGEDLPTQDPPAADVLDRHRRMSEGDEAARREYQARNGYRIWKYYKK